MADSRRRPRLRDQLRRRPHPAGAAIRRCRSCPPCSGRRSRGSWTATASWASCAAMEAATPSGRPSTGAGSCRFRRSATFAEGAAFPMAFLTAWIPLTQLLRVGFGARVLVTAAAGAVGTAAVQLVRALNGQPVAAVGSEEKFELPRSLGAVEAVTYERDRGARARRRGASTSSAATSSRPRSPCSSRSAPRSRSATRAGSGRT